MRSKLIFTVYAINSQKSWKVTYRHLILGYAFISKDNLHIKQDINFRTKQMIWLKAKEYLFVRILSVVRSPAEIVGSIPTGIMDVCLLWVLFECQLQVSVTSWSRAQRSPTDCGASFKESEVLKLHLWEWIWNALIFKI